jgi:hypothetical protein
MVGLVLGTQFGWPMSPKDSVNIFPIPVWLRSRFIIRVAQMIKSVIEQNFRMLSRRSHETSTKYPEMAARTLTAWVATPSRRTWIITEV